MNFNAIKERINPVSVLDIGAHVGNWYREAKTHWPDAYYLLIEGNPACSGALSDLGVSFRIALLSDTERQVPFHTRRGCGPTSGDSYYREKTPFYEGEQDVVVPLNTQRLDDVCEGQTFQLIKLDTQGSELDIIRGGKTVISAAKAVVIEVSHVEYNEGAPKKEQVIAELEALGFRQDAVVENINYCLPPHNHIQSSILFLK